MPLHFKDLKLIDVIKYMMEKNSQPKFPLNKKWTQDLFLFAMNILLQFHFILDVNKKYLQYLLQENMKIKKNIIQSCSTSLTICIFIYIFLASSHVGMFCEELPHVHSLEKPSFFILILNGLDCVTLSRWHICISHGNFLKSKCYCWWEN